MRIVLSMFFFHCSGDHPYLHSFPTRRSSDLHTGSREAGSSPCRACARLPGAGTAARATCHAPVIPGWVRSEEHTSELQSRFDLVCRLLLEKKKRINVSRHNSPV